MIVSDPLIFESEAYAAAAALYAIDVDLDEAYAEAEAEALQVQVAKPRWGRWTCKDCDVSGNYEFDPVCWFCGEDPWGRA